MFAEYRRIQERRARGEMEGGFTLIELLIVIVVLGILAAVVVFALGGVTGKSTIAACKADGTTITTAIAAFDAQNPGTTVTAADLQGSTLGGPYLQSWPTNVPHYAFAIQAGSLLINFDPGSTVPAQDQTGATIATPGTTSPIYVTTSSTWYKYTGPAMCDAVVN